MTGPEPIKLRKKNCLPACLGGVIIGYQWQGTDHHLEGFAFA